MSSDRGAVALEFAAGMALLVLPMALLVLVLPTWHETEQLGRDAVRHAARSAVTATTADENLRTVVASRLREQGVAVESVTVESVAGGVAVEARLVMPVAVLPFIGEVGGFAHTVRHVELRDPYRGAT